MTTTTEAPSRYMLSKFRREFREPMEFWTGEDGMLMSLVIRRDVDFESLLKSHHVFTEEDFDSKRIKERFVFRTRDFDNQWSHTRALWQVGDEVTPFPVYEYELENPR